MIKIFDVKGVRGRSMTSDGKETHPAEEYESKGNGKRVAGTADSQNKEEANARDEDLERGGRGESSRLPFRNTVSLTCCSIILFKVF